MQDILPLCVDILFVHEHVYNNEILFPSTVKVQIDALIDSGLAVVVSRSYVTAQKPEVLIIYDEIQHLLDQNITDSAAGHKNWGEILSLAFAKSMGVNYFLSDESYMQEIVDEYLNGDMGDIDNIQVIRVADFLSRLKEIGVERKTVKTVWLIYENENGNKSKNEIKRFKKWFDNEFWPVDQPKSCEG